MTSRLVSPTHRRWVTTRQKSSAGPVTRSIAPASPQTHRRPLGDSSSTRTSPTGKGNPRLTYEKRRVRTPSRATWKRRSVGIRSIPRASTMSWPCAHVSMSRALANDIALMSGPAHGSRSVGSWVHRAATVRDRAVLHHLSTSLGVIARVRWRCSNSGPSGLDSSLVSSAPKAKGSEAASAARSSLAAKCAI